MNCRFHDPSAPRHCREPQSELVREKAKANFCGFFSFAETAAGAGSGAEAARKTLDELFRK